MSIVQRLKSRIEAIVRAFFPGTYENIVKNKNKILSKYVSKERIPDLLVSMTTYHPRIDFFEYSLLSLLNGSILPEKILVYVPTGFKGLLSTKDSILRSVYEEGQIELVEMVEDVYCHSKYYYVFHEFGKEKDIVLCDDDVIYYKDWLEELYETSKKETDVNVFAYKAVEVTLEQDGAISPYENWRHCDENNLGKDKLLYAEAVGGVFYRRGSMVQETLNKEKFLELVPKADDVWLWFCSYLNKNKLRFILPRNNSKLLYTIPNSQETALWRDNTFAKRNDKYVFDCQGYFFQKYGLDITKQSLLL